MKHTKPWLGTIAVLFSISLVAAGCGDSGDESGDGSATTVEAASSATCREITYEEAAGGEFTDYAQLANGANNSSFDPQMVVTLEEAQITTALFDGLTDFDYSDTCNPKLEPLVAESFEANDDATVYTFKIKADQKFSDGEPVKPSNFKLAWERGGSAELASQYGYLISLIKDGGKLNAGEVTTLDSIVANDGDMTLDVTLEAPNADFPAILSHQFFSPISTADYEKIGNTSGWGTAGITVGNGPFKLESAGAADSGAVVLVRNDLWAGNVLGDTKATLDKITFVVTQDTDSAYQGFESGEGDSAPIPVGKYVDAQAKYPNTAGSALLSTYYYAIGEDDPQLGGEKNLGLRRAISLAIDRDEINEKAYEGVRPHSTGITPPGIPGFKADLCEYCVTDAAKAKEVYDEWVADGNSVSGPIQIDFNTGADHDIVAQIMQSNIEAALGIDVELNPVGDSYFEDAPAEGGCHICQSGWSADYPTYGNFTLDLFGAVSIGLMNFGRYDDEEFESLIADAQAETDDTKRGELYQQAEERLLNGSTAAIPINWVSGNQVYREGIVNYEQPPLGIIRWEKVGRTPS